MLGIEFHIPEMDFEGQKLAEILQYVILGVFGVSILSIFIKLCNRQSNFAACKIIHSQFRELNHLLFRSLGLSGVISVNLSSRLSTWYQLVL